MPGHHVARATRARVWRGPGLALLLAALSGFAAMLAFTGCTVEALAAGQTYAGVNAIRAEHGRPPLVPDGELANIARIRAQDMAARGYFSHDPPNGCNYACLLDNLGVQHAYAGENIAWNTWDWKQTAGVALQMWRNSPPHLENILNCHYTRFGAGVAKGADGTVYFTMIFEGAANC